jgi:oligopeptide/dipeptide ABC transporter ATP-binding protein
MALLEVRDLRVGFRSGDRVLYPVDGVSLQIEAGETVGVVGESGSGKTTLASALMRLLPKRDRPDLSGRVLWDGRDLLQISEAEMRALRGREISMVLQDPIASLNPVLTIGDQVAEAFTAHASAHASMTAATLRGRVVAALQRLGIRDPEARCDDYPHQLSGGMRQRVIGAIAMATPPRLLIADEPTTSLDVTLAAQYLALLAQLQRDFQMALLLITHDIGIVARMCDRVCVMYAGQIVESGPVERIFGAPAHWYTAALVGSVAKRGRKPERLVSIGGVPSRPGDRALGCRFAPRCSNARALCLREPPWLTLTASDNGASHAVRCWDPRMTPTAAASTSPT